MDPALHLLQSLRDFGWPVVAYAISAPLATFLIPSSRSREDSIARLLLAGVTIAIIELIFFAGLETGDFIQVAHLHPIWGIYVVCLALMAILKVAKWAILRRQENQEVISVTSRKGVADTSLNKTHLSPYIAIVGLWVLGWVVAVIWLSKIASGN